MATSKHFHARNTQRNHFSLVMLLPLVIVVVVGIGFFTQISKVSAASPNAVAPSSLPAGANYIAPGNMASYLANQNVTLHDSYHFSGSLQEMLSHADLVIIGHVMNSGVASTQPQPVDTPHSMTPAKPSPADKATLAQQQAPTAATSGIKPATTPTQQLPLTTFSVDVKQVLHGKYKVNQKIEVTQTGGLLTLPTYPGGPVMQRTFLIDDNPLLQQGEDALLFLSHDPEGRYVAIGAGQGHYKIVNGHIHTILPNIPVAQAYDNESVAAFAQTILNLP